MDKNGTSERFEVVKGGNIIYYDPNGNWRLLSQEDEVLPVIRNPDGSITSIDRRSWRPVTSRPSRW